MKAPTNLTAILLATGLISHSQCAVIEIHAGHALHPVSHYLTGACIEDVNHEIYGGLYSQMIYGESFQDPAPGAELTGFKIFGGQWRPSADGTLQASGDNGAKIVAETPGSETGEVAVELLFVEAHDGNAGLILAVNDAKEGADAFSGYEVSLETSGHLVLGRHRQNWEPIHRVACDVPLNQWISLAVQISGDTLEIRVNGKMVDRYQDTEHPLHSGAVGLRVWNREARFRNLRVTTGDHQAILPFAAVPRPEVSSQWRAINSGDAQSTCHLDKDHPFLGTQSQSLAFTHGTGMVGIENHGLYPEGMAFAAGKPYDGCIWARSVQPCKCSVALIDGEHGDLLAQAQLNVTGVGWQKLDFTLTPGGSTEHGRFAIELAKPGAITVGYAFLEPGDWGRFAGLPVRREVAQGMIDQGITVLRYGGSMVNADEYRWKKMLGPRDRRPPYRGLWHPCSSNGWGIIDFLNFCEAAGFLGIPDFNVNESPQDLADFVEYVNGPVGSVWGARRAADGHPQPYHLKYLELGNEERVDDRYAAKFEALAKSIWAKDPGIIPVVGDFCYQRPFADAFHVTGADSGIKTLAGQQRVLRFAKACDHEVWFDVHVWTEGPRPGSSLDGAISFRNALKQVAEGARFHVCIFELNANNPTQRRALANAVAIQKLERDGGFPVVTSANGLQPDGQNDNGWDQGLLFLNPDKVWLQPPGCITRMLSQNYEPQLVECHVTDAADLLDTSAKRSDDGKTLVLQVVNLSDKPVTATLKVDGFVPQLPTAKVEELAGPLDAKNTADDSRHIQSRSFTWNHQMQSGSADYEFPPSSFTVLKFN